MPVIATEPKRFSDLVKVSDNQLWNAGYMTESVTVNEASAQDYEVGTLLGKVTANGKYKIWDSAAEDGSEVLAAVVLENKSVAATTDTAVWVAVRGGLIVADKALELNGETLADAKAGLEALNPPIVVASQI
jgi:hypothetical protein